MAQKINSFNLRLSKKLNWQMIFTTHNLIDYANQLLNATKISTVQKNTLFKLKFMLNFKTIVKNSKNFRLNYTILNKNLFFMLVKSLITQPTKNSQNYYQHTKKYLILFLNLFEKFNFDQKQLIYQTIKIQPQKKQKEIKNIIFSPNLISHFTKMQLKTNEIVKLNQNNFNVTLQKSITKLVEILVKNHNFKIIGLKISCVGRWKKTNTGRKQNLNINFGQMKRANIANTVLYHNSTETTKFGVCSIKVWIAQKL